jgi:Zn-dependent metalloprotease
MKKIISLFTILFLVATYLAAQTTHFDSVYYSNNAYHFNDITKITVDNIFTTYKSQFGLGVNDSMRVEHTAVEEYGFHRKYGQYYKGYLVEDGVLNVIGKHGVVAFVNGNLIKNLSIPVSTTITQVAAIDSAKRYLSSSVSYLYLDATYISNVQDSTENNSFAPLVDAVLLVTKRPLYYSTNDSSYALAWKVSLETSNPYAIHHIYVDALSGAILKTENLQNDYVYSNTGSGWTLYNGSYSNLGTGHCATCTKWRLYSNNNVQTHKVVVVNNNPEYEPQKDGNNNWVESDTKNAASAHWCAERARSYYLNAHGRWGSDYNGRWLNVFTEGNSLLNGSTAAYQLNFPWAGDNIAIRNVNTAITPPDAWNSGVGYSAATLDIIGHEYTHAMIGFSSNLKNYGDAGAIAEGICDVFGISVEADYNGSCDWSIGEDANSVRYFNDPANDESYGTAYPSPSIYQGANWGTSLYNNGAIPNANQSDVTIHRNSGVLRKWFYLLSQGGTFNGQTVTALGMAKAKEILYITFNWWLWNNLKYTEAAQQSVSAAIHHYNKCSQEHKSVVQAWKAVGITVPISCPQIIIKGDVIVHVPDIGTANTPLFKAELDGGGSPTASNLTWYLPSSWSTSISSSKTVTLNSTSNYNSQMVKVRYELDDEYYYDSIYVHFSETEMEGDNNLPPSERSAKTEPAPTEYFAVYPNPAADKLNIVVPLEGDNGVISIYDFRGQLVSVHQLSQQFSTISTSALAEGLYLVKYTGNNYTKMQKILIKH